MASFLKRFIAHAPLILKKSQMNLFDWQPTHEEERTVHATVRHLESGKVVQVQEHQRRTKISDKQEKHKDSLKHTDENYRYKDVGHVPGSRKEMAAEQASMIKQRGKSGAGVNHKEINFDTLEDNPREAYDLITKDTIAKEVDWQAMKEQGVDPGAAFLMSKLYTAVAPRPEDSADARKDFVYGINALQDRFADAKTVDDVKSKIEEIREEMSGFSLNPEQQKEWDAMEGQQKEIYTRLRALKKEKEALWNAYYGPSQRLQGLKYEQEKRTRRGWKPDPELQDRIQSLQKDVDAAYQVQNDWRTQNQSTLDAVEKEAEANYQKRQAFKNAVIAKNIIEHPLTRGWNSFGKKFYSAINYLSYKGSDSFATHMATAKSGKIQDWSWLDKEKAPRKASEQSVRFQLKVADRIEREGGSPLPAQNYGTEDLQKEFHLANVQSGNWVLKDLNAAKHHTEQCGLAFQDMSDMLGIPHEEVSFNNRLSIAFGARGTGGFNGGAAAHYENKYRVINLTKMKGGGSLAHEYFHFLDDVIGEVETGERKGRETYATAQKPTTEVLKAFNDLVFTMEDGNHNESVKQKMTITEAEKNHWLQFIDRQRKFNFYGPTGRMVKEIIDAPNLSDAIAVAYEAKKAGRFGANTGAKAEKQYQLFKQLALAHHAGTEGVYDVAGFNKGSKFYVESQKIDAAEKNKDYWASRKEMAARAFAAYMSDKLHDHGRENTYLTSYADNKYYIMDGIKPFPEGEERKAINRSFDRLFEAIRQHKTLQKSQLNLFDWQPTHEEIHQRRATTRHTASGATVQVSATQAKTKVKDHPAIAQGTKVYYRTPDMERKKKGTIISGDHKSGYMIKPVREGGKYNPEPIYAPREHLWTQDEHAFKLLRPKATTAEKQAASAANTGRSETEILQHPQFVGDMHRTLKYLANTNGMNPHYKTVNGTLRNEDPAADELYSTYVTAAMTAYRSAASKAKPEDVEEFHRYLDGVSKNSNIAASMHRSGRTATIRHIVATNEHNNEHQQYDSAMEDDMESGMRSVSATAAEDKANTRSAADKVNLELNVKRQLKRLDDPVAEYILTAKYGLGDLEHAYKEQDIAASLNKRKIPAADGEAWTTEKVQARIKDALTRLYRTKGVQELRTVLKSLRDIDELRKSQPTEHDRKLAKIEIMFEQHLLVKSHIKEYTREDGTVVQAHDDKRMKHDHIAGHELSHGDQIHTGAKLKHGQELVDHLKSKGWKHKEVSAVRSNGKEPGSKKDMPKPPEIKGANKENSALKSAQSVINKMHEAASKHADPATYLKHITTSRSNPYLKAVDDYRTALLNHFGHDVDHDTKDHRYEKDGHVVTLSEKDGKHTVEHAGYEEKGQKDNSVNPAKDTLTQAIAKIGGMHAGEAKRQFDLTGKDFPDIKSALKKDGLDPDKVAEILSQHGYIKTDANGKHDYDDFQDKLRRAATGEKVYSVQRDQKDVEDELAKQEKEYLEQRGIDDPSSEAVGFEELHEEAKKEYGSVFEEALDVLGKEATNKLIAMYQHDVPFNVKDYVDAKLRRHIDEHKGHSKQGDDSTAGKQDAAGGSGQNAAVDSGNDTGKGATAGKPAAATDAGERPRSGTGADAVTVKETSAHPMVDDILKRFTSQSKLKQYLTTVNTEKLQTALKITTKHLDSSSKYLEKMVESELASRQSGGTGADAVTFSKLKAAVDKHDPSFRYTDNAKSPDYRSGQQRENEIIKMAKELYKKDPQRTMSALASTGIMEHQIAPYKPEQKPKSASIASLEKLLGSTMQKSVGHVAYIRRNRSGKVSNVAGKGSPREQHLTENTEQARQYIAKMWRHGAEESDIIAGLHKQYGIKGVHAAAMLEEHKRNKGA